MEKEEICKKLLALDSSILRDFVSNLREEHYSEAPEIVTDFYVKNGAMEELLDWILQEEVQITKHFGDLFREDNFRVNCIRSLLYGDEGTQFLQQLLQGLVVEASKKDSIVPSNIEVNRKKALKLAKRFIKHFGKTVSNCPGNIRRLFSLTNRIVMDKFPRETPFIVDFVFFYFICPALVNPAKFKLITENENAPCILIQVSKILNDLALNSTDKHKDPEIVSFIAGKQDMVIRNVNVLIDLSNSRIAKSPSFTVQDKEMAASAIFVLFQDIGLAAKPASHREVAVDSPEMFKMMYDKWDEKLNSPNWKKVHDKNGVAAFTLKTDLSQVVAVKSITTINLPPSRVREIYKQVEQTPELEPTFVKSEILKEAKNFKQYCNETKVGFPFHNRDYSMNVWTYETSDGEGTKFTRVFDNSDDAPRRPKCVRMKLYLSGMEIAPVSGHPELTLVTNVAHGDPKGALPAWAVNMVVTGQLERIVNLKKICEATTS